MDNRISFKKQRLRNKNIAHRRSNRFTRRSRKIRLGRFNYLPHTSLVVSIAKPFQKYIDDVFTQGHNNGIYKSDGRSRVNPDINYGTGGLLHGRKYMLTTSWNAPATAFTLPGEFFEETSVDDGVMFGFHKMNKFTGMERLNGFHFHDVEKGATPENIVIFKENYTKHLEQTFKNL
ncbi:Modulator of drug activity B [Flavobacterium anhuiense]|uniref:Modulator of drug activity B n=1 Tax=Flavobacterium anhuiense TaxID=459526 RepID=A0AAC9GKD5_9FLAO|nr:Modulator of drug activity B [Flavobacterium anhuiense]